MNELIQNVLPAAASAVRVGVDSHAQAPREAVNPQADAESQERQAKDNPTSEQLVEAIDRLAKAAFGDSRLNIEKHDGAGVFVYRLVDKDNGSVVRQWPTEDFLSLREYLRTQQAGIVDKKA